MIDQINDLIDTNLKLICETKSKELFAHEFIDINGNELTQKIKGEKFADEMESRGLIRRKNQLCIVEEYGYEIYRKGGWKKSLVEKEDKEQKELNKSELNEKLEIEIKVLQKDNLEYQRKIREQTDRIRNLDEQIKSISLLKQYWWVICLCIGIGIFIGKILEQLGIM